MRLKKSMETHDKGVMAVRKGYFRTSLSVMADTILNRTYDFKVKALSDISEETQKRKQALWYGTSLTTRYLTNIAVSATGQYLAWLAKSAGGLISTAGPIVMNTLISVQFSLLSMAVVAVKKAFETKEPAIHSESAGRQAKKTARPSFATYLGILGAVDVAYLLTHDFIASAIAKLGQGQPSPFLAMGAILAGTAIGLIVDGAGFAIAWALRTKTYFKPISWYGEFKGFIRGFAGEFRPIEAIQSIPRCIPRLARHLPEEKAHQIPESAGEYAGLLYGTMESYYIWVQAVRCGIAAWLSAKGIDGAMLVTALWAEVSKKAGWFTVVIQAKFYDTMEKRIKETNQGIGLGGER